MLARLGSRMIARARPFRFEVPTSGMAEAYALFCAIQACKQAMPNLVHATIHIDCLALVEAMRARKRHKGIGNIVQAIDDYAVDEGIEISIHWVKGHRVEGARGVANAVAHRLAWLGRHHDVVDLDLPFDIHWQGRLYDADPRLIHLSGDDNVPFEQVTRILGVGPDVVAKLMKHGHLDYDTTGVTLHSLNKVVSQTIRLRAERGMRAEPFHGAMAAPAA